MTPSGGVVPYKATDKVGGSLLKRTVTQIKRNSGSSMANRLAGHEK
jgi:hypothetical protein